LKPLNVFVGFSSFLVFFTIIIVMLIIFTPLKEYIPGYTDPDMRRNLNHMMYKADSLEQVLQERDNYYGNILHILKEDSVVNQSTK